VAQRWSVTKGRPHPGRVAVLATIVVLGLSVRPAVAQVNGEPQIIGHPEQYSAQGQDGTNCTWALSLSWDVWNNTQAPYALTSVAYRGFWEVRDGPNDYHVPITVDDGGLRAGVMLSPGRNSFHQSATLTAPCNSGWFGVIVNVAGPYGTSGGSATWGEFVNGTQIPVAPWQGGLGLAAVLGVVLYRRGLSFRADIGSDASRG
jgi:hypothetical protein